METYGEDPYLTGRMAVQFIKGLQGDNPKYLKWSPPPSTSRFTAGPEPLRHSFDARVDDADLRETYLPQFEAAVREGGAFSVMWRLQPREWRTGVRQPAAAGRDFARRMGLPVTWSRIAAPWGDIYQGHKVAATLEEAAARALKAGTDLDAARSTRRWFRRSARSSSPRRKSIRPYAGCSPRGSGWACSTLRRGFPMRRFHTPSMTARSTARWRLRPRAKSIVLLKNEKGMLPLRKG